MPLEIHLIILGGASKKEAPKNKQTKKKNLQKNNNNFKKRKWNKIKKKKEKNLPKKKKKGTDKGKKQHRQQNSLLATTYLFKKRNFACFQKDLIVSMSGVRGIILNRRITEFECCCLTGPFFLKNTFKQHFSSASKRLLRGWDCVRSCTVDLDKLYYQSAPCVKQDNLMYRKILDCCLFPEEETHWCVLFISAEHWASWDSFFMPDTVIFFIKTMLHYWGSSIFWQPSKKLHYQYNFFTSEAEFSPLPCLSEATEVRPKQNYLH